MTATCDIPAKQNGERTLNYIAAWSHLYGHAKVVAGWQLALSVPAALAMALIALWWPGAKLVTTPLSLLFGYLDILWLDRVQAERKKVGAKAQELFDCEVLGLEWNKVRCAEEPEPEPLKDAADEYRRTGDTSKHKDWYPVEVARLPLPLARLICQRAAVWWDMSQRREYSRWLVGIVIGLVLGVVATAYAADGRVRDMVLSVYLPIAPAVVWALREYLRQADAVTGLEKLKGRIEVCFDEAIDGKHDTEKLERFARNVQDMIFDGRSRNPLFFNFIYDRLRDRKEIRMNERAKELVDKALAKSGSWNL